MAHRGSRWPANRHGLTSRLLALHTSAAKLCDQRPQSLPVAATERAGAAPPGNGERPEDGRAAAHQEALRAAGVTHSSALVLEFLQWRCLRIGLPLRLLTQDAATGAAPRAAAQTAEALQLLLGISAAGQRLDPEALEGDAQSEKVHAARDALTYAAANVDQMIAALNKSRGFALRPKYPF